MVGFFFLHKIIMAKFKNTGTKRTARTARTALKKFDHVRTYRQYSIMEDQDRETMYLQWCCQNQKDPEREGQVDEFFSTLDQSEIELTANTPV